MNIPSLALMGHFETDGAAYDLFGHQADLVARSLAARRDGGAQAERLGEILASRRPDLQGGRRYVASPRHRYYVTDRAYRRAMAAFRREMGWI